MVEEICGGPMTASCSQGSSTVGALLESLPPDRVRPRSSCEFRLARKVSRSHEVLAGPASVGLLAEVHVTLA